MKVKVIFTAVFLFLSIGLFPNTVASPDSLIQNDVEAFDLDSLLNNISVLATGSQKIGLDSLKIKRSLSDTLFDAQKSMRKVDFIPVDSLILKGNPLFIDLVYKEEKINFDRHKNLYPYTFYFGESPAPFAKSFIKSIEVPSAGKIIRELRLGALKSFTLKYPSFFVFRYENLPSTDGVKSHIIDGRKAEAIQLVNISKVKGTTSNKLVVPKMQRDPWTRKANTMIQFSQNYVSNNWYQGGNQNIAILGILTGQLNYDDKKNIQWDNNAEWRMGFNSVDGDTLRVLNTNDDNLKINSKLGLKAGGKWFYSGSVDFSTQLFHNYKAVNSPEMKASLLTPVRLNIGVGLDYKYKKLFSLAFSPISYKYIYVNDTINVNQNLFGIEKGKNVLSEIGSSFKGVLSYAPAREIQIDSKLSFYTNYEKVEIDWEIVGNFTINRFLSTRISLNPRYDNTQILAAGDKARLQFKELLSFGFSYKLLN
ncbi:MAG: DUF3078 domain-containing protein [Bacteroidales bacterium]|nr:DUF3078 domain-containing protein [Bacteroidales bacterium]